MGILVNVGTRDETAETSGALLAIKNTYLKTLKHTNETINYGMVQMSGGETTMEYDEETMWYHSYCFEYDTLDMFRMLADCAFEPRSYLAANVIFLFIFCFLRKFDIFFLIKENMIFYFYLDYISFNLIKRGIIFEKKMMNYLKKQIF